MTSTLAAYAKAAKELPMAWLTQSEFPAKDLVESSFQDALAELPAPEGYEDSLVRSALESVIAGPDPRGGKFQSQAIQAAAKLHDRVVTLALEPKPRKIRRNAILHGYCGGLLGESYGHKLVTEVGLGYVVYASISNIDRSEGGVYHGDVEDLEEYLVPDQDCPENCHLGED